jgi:sigma-B regulation protein RsbU (phosphoserine phosphatase)
VTGLVNALPQASPAEIVCQLNRVMRLNIRERLDQAEHATFLMCRYRSDGSLVLAGAHEELVVFRASKGRCERYPTNGVWLGIAEDISAMTSDSGLTLELGDVLLLYTDGLIEARSANGEELGIDRVEEILRTSAHSSVESILERLVSAVSAWTPVQQDDVTLILARRTA